jgi:hypothetical protein
MKGLSFYRLVRQHETGISKLISQEEEFYRGRAWEALKHWTREQTFTDSGSELFRWRWDWRSRREVLLPR